MLRITKKSKQEQIERKGEVYTVPDIIVEKSLDIETVRDDGIREIHTKTVQVNLTKKINETAKIYKRNQAEEKLAEIEQIFTK